MTGKSTAGNCLPALLAGLLAWPAFAGAATSCEAHSGARQLTVVELYTSEGCSSCPPADRWLSSLDTSQAGNDGVLPLAFHVTYWDRLGWADRFASPAYTERQNQLATAIGAKVIYTPQVIVNGADWRGWPKLPKSSSVPEVDLQLSRDGDTFTAAIKRREGVTARSPQIAGYWAVVENGHRTEVRAGENAGSSLRHDHVVRAYQPVAAWSSEREQRLQWRLPRIETADSQQIERSVAFVVTDARTQKPLQALALSC